MPKNPKTKKLEKSLDGKSAVKKKGTKTKLSDTSKSSAETEHIKNVIINDEKWQCSIVLFVSQNHSLNNFLLNILVNIPENFTVLTKDAIAKPKDKNSAKSPIPRSSIRSTSKGSKHSSKSKSTKSKKGTKEKEEEVKSSNNEIDSFKECLALKKLIIGLRNTDIENTKKSITDGKTNITESKLKNNDLRTRGSGVDDKITVTEENSKSTENPLHRFVLLLGFYDPMLPEVLIEQNVSMKAIVNVRNTVDDNIETYSNEIFSPTVTDKSKRKTSRKGKKGSIDGKLGEYSSFFERIVELSCIAEFLERCKDVVFLNYTIKNLSTKTKEIEVKHKCDLLGMLYKIKDAWKKYIKFTKAVHIQNIPTVSEILKLEDAKIYTTMITMVPLECTSISVILHCILEQIEWWNDDKCFSEGTDSNFFNDSSTQSNSSSASKPFNKNKTPILIHHRDEVKSNTFHLDLPEFDFEHISINVLMKSPIFKLWERYPPQTQPVRKWFEFQLQKLQNLSDNFILKLDSLFPLYLHYFLMDVIVFKINQFTHSKDDIVISEPEAKKINKLFLTEKEPELCHSNSNLFVKEIIYNILSKVPDCSLCQSYAEVFEIDPNFFVETSQCTLKQPVYTNRLKNMTSKELSCETLLQKKQLKIQEKLDKLVSILNCSEFVSLYEDFSKLNFCESSRLAKYRFIEILNTQTLCQCFHLASQAFHNIYYDYFPVTDTILLWFNNSVQVLSSHTLNGVLETCLGFRDFYCHKLRERMDFGDTDTVYLSFEDKEKIGSSKCFDERSDLFMNEHITYKESCIDHHSKVEERKKNFNVEEIKPTLVYNLGSLWMEATESYNNFFSIDSSSVTVKQATYFNNKAQFVVNVNKNNTTIRYELDPDCSNNFVQLFVDVHETLVLNCVLKWDIVSEKIFTQRNNTVISENFETGKNSKFKLNCRLSITLPSGLFIEVVPTNSVFGPFYIRQRYLGKGPNCSSIWEENYRCYFSNGMVLIFRVDGFVDIIYNNGTVVKVNSIELINTNDWTNTKGTKIDTNVNEAGNVNLNKQEIQKTKEGSNNQQKKKGKVKADQKKNHSDNDDGKETSKHTKTKKDRVKKGSKITTEINEENISLVKETKDNIPLCFKIVQHSVLSWDGEFTQYNSDNCTGIKKQVLSLKTAFDIVNHELYWQRSDGMSCLQAQSYLMMKFPDGSKTTSYTIDNKELRIENDYVIIYRNSGDLVNVESLNGSHDTNSIDFKLNKVVNRDSNYNTHLTTSSLSSIDSLSTETSEGNSFVYIENCFLMEHTNYASVEFSKEEFEIKLILPGNCWVIVDESGGFSFKGNKNERINLFNDNLVFEANVLRNSTLSKSRTTLRFENVGTVPIIFSQTEDSFGHVFSVDERGNTTYLPPASCENLHQPHCTQYFARFPQNTERFFVFNRNLTGYEFVHEAEQANTLSNEEVQTINTPLIKDDSELYNLYIQSPIYRSKCEEYNMENLEVITPSLIKRKDLLKTHKTPEIIWFYQEMSYVKELMTNKNEKRSTYPEKTLKAMMIVQRLKVIKKGFDVISLFSKSFTKYMEINEQIYQKYLNYYPKETFKEEDLIEREANKMNFLGSKSYYLTDNLPVVVTGDMASDNKSNMDIFSIFSPSISKISLLQQD